MTEAQREDLTLYKDYADPELYNKVMGSKPFRARSVARSIYVIISMKHALPDKMSPAYMKRLDAGLQRNGTSLRDIVNDALREEIKEESDFEACKNDEKFRKAYAKYAANPDTYVVD